MIAAQDSYAEQLKRVRHMVSDEGRTWRFSERDREALAAVLYDRDVLRAALEVAAEWVDADLLLFGSGPLSARQSRVNRVHAALDFMEHRS